MPSSRYRRLRWRGYCASEKLNEALLLCFLKYKRKLLNSENVCINRQKQAEFGVPHVKESGRIDTGGSYVIY